MIDKLLELLNTTGVDFVRDAWVSAPPGDYGVVDIAQDRTIFADNRPLHHQLTANVWLYTHDGGEDKAAAVRAVLVDVPHMISCQQAGREFIGNPQLVQWHFTITMRGVA